MKRGVNGKILPKRKVDNPKSPIAGIRLRFGGWLDSFVKKKVGDAGFDELASKGYEIATSDLYINHRDRYRFWAWFMNLALENPAETTNNNVTVILEQQQRGMDSARVKLGIRPVNISVVDGEKVSDEGETKLKLLPQSPGKMVEPVASPNYSETPNSCETEGDAGGQEKEES
jgi:hypothetical protein